MTGDAALLAVVDAAGGARRIRVTGPLTLGRDDDAGLVIDDPEISRAHAVLAPGDHGLEIRDLASLNGTWVNGERIKAATALVPGDVVKIGGTRIEVLAAAGPALAAAARSAPTPVEAEDELRPVSVLFADIVGSTPLAEQLEPEEFGAIVGGCVDRMCRAVERFGGVIDAYMGDGIAAFFGFPAATEDDADRAARAALEVVDAIREYAEEVRVQRGLACLNVRVGVNSGQAAIGVVGAAERHPVALGDTMNVAARLQGHAEPGTIVIGGATARKLQGRFLVRPLGQVTVRGRQRPVEAWRLLSARADRVRNDPCGFVGRARERAQLLAAADALLEGRGRVVVLSGEPGIGKTRLLEWFRDHVRDDVTWLDGRCTSYGTSPAYHALVDALRRWVGAGDPEQRAATLERLGLEPDSLPYFATLLAGAEPDRHGGNGVDDEFAVAFADAYASWLRGICAEAPAVLAVHDIHWADQGTLGVLERLSRLVTDCPLLIAVTSRATPNGSDRQFREDVQSAYGKHLVDVALGPLADDEAEKLLCQAAPGELAPEARREVIALAEGNPLYVEHLLRSLLESGGLAARRTWALTVSAAQLPTGLESLLIARIAGLPRDARRVAQVAAVLGRTFDAALLAQVAGVDDLELNLMRLLRANIIGESRPFPIREYTFTHGLLQEAALSTLTRTRRRELYARVAAAFEQAFSDSLDEHLEEIAFYHGRAGDLSRALEYLERAADRAASLRAHTQAASLWSRAASVAERANDPNARERLARRLVELST